MLDHEAFFGAEKIDHPEGSLLWAPETKCWGIKPCFGSHGVHGDVPGCRGKLGDALAFVGNADQAWATPPAVVQKGQAAVVVAAAHTEPVELGIEANQGHEDEVELAQGAWRPCLGVRLQDAKAIGSQPVAGLVAGKPELPLAAWLENRQVTADGGGAQGPEEWAKIDFSIGGQVEAKMAATPEPAAGEYALADGE